MAAPKGMAYKEITDKDGVAFWTKHFAETSGDEVPWAKFYEAFEKEFPFPDFAQKDQIGKKCLQAFIAENPKSKDIVTATAFKDMLDWFGPLKSEKPMIGRMMDVMAQSWFFGDLSAQDAGKILGTGDNTGRFLVRLGHKIAGSFVVTYLKQGKKEKEMAHIQIEYGKGMYTCKKEKIKEMPKLSKLIKQLMAKYPSEIAKPCVGAPYARLFPYYDGDDSD